MFKNTFSFDGRIRRTEYGLSLIITFIGYLIAFSLTTLLASWITIDTTGVGLLFWVFFLPVFYFNITQNTKRCHDLGKSGWFQMIPFYIIMLLFIEGKEGTNAYGRNPKEICLYENMQEATRAS
ncbi:DUF805 domain-containing protein [Joostella atrarenae]|uniref:DUF805 domain-containing protein n=1 Tax=Joostella atrarenae TaxID=679257 RepID=A0ABS9J3K7_9FLAO|nr:DUF805 domain-containing protein [Joostella atrarenae]MCF8715016.1 DUF805 domain-containing protein [Joostella atrarenae]